MMDIEHMNSGHDSGVVTGASSDEGDQQGCPHSSSILERIVSGEIQRNGISMQCNQCLKYELNKSEECDSNSDNNHLWLCCTCGTQLCDQNKKAHAKSHYESDKSHPISINTITKVAWCYSCSKEYSYSMDSDVGKVANQITTIQKKRSQFENQKHDSVDTGASSDDADQPDCPHVNSVYERIVVFQLKQHGLLSQCPKCDKDDDSGIIDGYEIDNTLWLCCHCGAQLCGRNKNAHALDHYKSESACHSISINTTKNMAWCYGCDKEHIFSSDSNVGKIANFVKTLRNSQMATTKNSIAAAIPLSPPPPPAPTPIVLKISTTPANSSVTVSKKGLMTSGGMQRVCGLTNLGNTCFFNAVLQCLVQTPFLLPILKQSSKAGERFELPGGEIKGKQVSPIEGELKSWNTLTSTLAETLEELQTSIGGTFTPSKLFNTFVKAQPQFSGGDQHDSHELLRHLLDSVRNDDMNRYKKKILRQIAYSKSDSGAVLDEKTAACKLYGSQVNDRILIPEHVFRGFLVSTLTCRDCNHTSPRNESFLDISLPVNVPTNSCSSSGYGSSGRRKKSDSPPPPMVSKKEKRNEKKKAKKIAKKERKMSKLTDDQQKSEDQIKTCPTPSSSSDGSDSESKNCPPVGHTIQIECYDSNGNRQISPIPADEEPVTMNGECTPPESPMDDGSKQPDTITLDFTLLDASQNQLVTMSISDKGKETVMKQLKNRYQRQQNRNRTNSYTECSTTFAPPYQCEDNECSIQSCLQYFTEVEHLSGNNKVGCDRCTERFRGKNGKTYDTEQTKQLLISTPPAVMILHLKRFQLGPMCRFRKLSDSVTFPLILDMAPFCASTVKRIPSVKRKQTKIVYSLYGVVEHSGGMHGGHYIAYVKVRAPLSDKDPRWKFVPKNSTKHQVDEQKAKLDGMMEKARARDMRQDDDSDDSASESSFSDEMDAGDEDEEEQQQRQAYEDNLLPPPGKWYYASDSMVTEVDENRVLKAQAYLLFYERIY